MITGWGSWLRAMRGMALVALIGAVAAPPALAHEIPVDARLNAFVVPVGKSLTILLRAPLGSMGDIDYPSGPGNTVAVSRADQSLIDATNQWIIPAIEAFENGRQLPMPKIVAARISLPSDRTFGSFESARAHMGDPRLDDDLNLYWSQQFIDVLLEYPIESDRSKFAIDLRVDRFGESVTTALRFMPPDSETRALEFRGNVGLINLDPTWLQAALSFVREGIFHILTGTDHMLFLACLVIPFRRIRPLIAIATAFTVGHSISLAATALGYAPDALWFAPLVELLIAASIFYMALENILGYDVRRRWVLAFAFGLVHGCGFAADLTEFLQFAGNHLLASLFSFNVGVEIGQIIVLLVLAPALQWFLTRVPSEGMGIIVLSAVAAHIAWHWMEERWSALAKFPAPQVDVLTVIGAMRGAMVLLALGGLVWLVSGALNRWVTRGLGDKAAAE